MNKIQLILVTAWPPTRFHAGGQRQLDIYTYLKKTGAFELSLYSRDIEAISNQIDRRQLSRIFDNIYWAKSEILSGEELGILSDGTIYDILDLQHFESARDIYSFEHLKKKVIYTPMESELRNFAIKARNFDFSLEALKRAIREIILIRNSHMIVSVSCSDEKYLKFFGKRKTFRIDTPISESFLDSKAISKKVDFEKRTGIVFAAYFGSQTNLDALDWYITNVHRPLLKDLPEIRLVVVGDKSDELKDYYLDPNVEFLGRVEDLVPHIANARIAISPAIHGSGFRGKINQYSILSIPTVAHPLAVSGLNYPKESIAVCNSAAEWVSAIKELYFDKKKNLSIGARAYKHASTFKLENQQLVIKKIYNA